MKKLALCLLVLALAVLVVPKSQAAQRCIRFPNFCDSIEFDDVDFGGQYGFVTWGAWDWQCNGSRGDTNIIGRGGSKLVFGTRPVNKSSRVASAYSFMFVLTRDNRLFDLYKTSGDSDDGGGIFQVRVNQAWTLKQGSCGYSGAKANKPRLLDPQ